MNFLMKQRLVGTVVLVALAVIFIPMLLENPDQTLVPKMDELPELVDQRLSETYEFPPELDSEPFATAEKTIVSRDVPAEVPTNSEQITPPTEAEVTSEAASEATTNVDVTTKPKPESVPTTPEQKPAAVAEQKPNPAEPLTGWVVQVGSFSSEDNALALRDRMRKAGFVTQVEKVKVEGNTHFRVRIGPFLERADAEKNNAALDKKLTLKGRVLSYP